MDLGNLLRFVPHRSGILTTRESRNAKPYDRKSASSVTWTHKFVCLADTEFDHVPTATERYNLKCSDLGEKKLCSMEDGLTHIMEKLIQAYPALDIAGRFELRRTDGPYSRHLVTIDTAFLAAVS